MTRIVATAVVAASFGAAMAWAGHELPIYPSFYPHEIEIQTVAPERALALRLAAYELLHRLDTPVSVVIATGRPRPPSPTWMATATSTFTFATTWSGTPSIRASAGMRRRTPTVIVHPSASPLGPITCSATTAGGLST